jgi:hypothetical protein
MGCGPPEPETSRTGESEMSYATIKALWPGEKHEDLKTMRNGQGIGPPIWGELSERYLGGRHQWLVGEQRNVDALYNREDVPGCLRHVLMMTFNHAYVAKKDYAEAAADIREFLRISPELVKHVNHWPAIADMFESDPDCPAIGFRLTSVNDDPFLDKWDEENNQCDPFDWSLCWSVYDWPVALRKLNSQEKAI